MSSKGCLSSVAATVAFMVMLILLIAVSIGAEAAGYKWYKPWVKNKEYALVRHSNEYVDSKQSEIMGLLDEYNKTESTITFYQGTPAQSELVAGLRGQQKAKITQMCDAANKIQDNQVPDAAKPLMRAAGCWEGY